MSGACEVGALAAPEDTAGDGAIRREARDGVPDLDDLLDYTADEAITGKPSGLDLREHKVTLPLIYALPRLSRGERATLESLIGSSDPEPGAIAAVVAAVAAPRGLDYARERAQRLRWPGGR